MVGSGERKEGSEILASHLQSRSEQADRLITIPTALVRLLHFLTPAAKTPRTGAIACV